MVCTVATKSQHEETTNENNVWSAPRSALLPFCDVSVFVSVSQSESERQRERASEREGAFWLIISGVQITARLTNTAMMMLDHWQSPEPAR